ncbi:hypothetical protein BJY04DRAFT_193711 [Aspergillus karnatakaensis]|uniref:uncharacterized protein n=1 Tax=Aspergillus karnatakaensis TaxID=1810916 RepID=UPI003CCD48F4
MAVNALPETLSTSTPNKRLPPLADRSSLSYKLTNLSKAKLAREATAADPDIRRCLSHFRLHVKSIEWAQQEAATKITSFEFETDDESEEETMKEDEQEEPMVLPSPEAKLEQPEVSVPAAVSKDEQIHVHFEVVAPMSEKEKDAGIVDKGRRCLEKAQGFGFSPAQCMPVRIAG